MLLQNRLASLNSGQRRAEATMTFGTFVAEQFVPDILPTLKYATQKIYSLILRKHLFPRFRDCRLCDITRAEVQQFVTGKLKDGYAWETTSHLRTLLSKVIGTAVSWNYLSGQSCAWRKDAGTHAQATAPLSHYGTGEAFDRGVRGTSTHNRLAGGNDGAAYRGDSRASMGSG